MSDPIQSSLHAEGLAEPGARGGVKIETNAKGLAQVKVSVYVGDTPDEMQAVLNLAVDVYETTISRLGARANF